MDQGKCLFYVQVKLHAVARSHCLLCFDLSTVPCQLMDKPTLGIPVAVCCASPLSSHPSHCSGSNLATINLIAYYRCLVWQLIELATSDITDCGSFFLLIPGRGERERERTEGTRPLTKTTICMIASLPTDTFGKCFAEHVQGQEAVVNSPNRCPLARRMAG